MLHFFERGARSAFDPDFFAFLAYSRAIEVSGGVSEGSAGNFACEAENCGGWCRLWLLPALFNN